MHMQIGLNRHLMSDMIKKTASAVFFIRAVTTPIFGLFDSHTRLRAFMGL